MNDKDFIKQVFAEAGFNDATVEDYGQDDEGVTEYAVNLGDWLITPYHLGLISGRVEVKAISSIKPYSLKMTVSMKAK